MFTTRVQIKHFRAIPRADIWITAAHTERLSAKQLTKASDLTDIAADFARRNLRGWNNPPANRAGHLIVDTKLEGMNGHSATIVYASELD